MKITKYVHSCLLVEMPAPVNRTALFDPGVMSEAALDVEKLMYLDDIFITHNHSDHLSVKLLKKLVAKFPDVRITSTEQTVRQLATEGVKASSAEPEGVSFFDAPHESMEPLKPGDPDQNVGFHYLKMLSHPGDSHSFVATCPILALPVSAPWGTSRKAVELATELKPQHVLPIHDWHWHDEARQIMYERFEAFFGGQGITFVKLTTGKPVVITLD